MKASHQPAVLASRSRKPRLVRRLLLLALSLGIGGQALAQRVPTPTLADTVRQRVDLPPATIDSLAVEPLVPNVDSVRLLWLQTPATLYETVNDRMGCLTSDMPLHFNEAVLAYVRLFTERKRSYTQRVLEREQFYFPTFEKYLAQYNLPTDLKYLSVVESALIPTAKSPVGALGLWQFMPPTAGDLRLKHDEWVDERIHPEKATEAACKHLRYLYGLFHDWELVLAAYNWGAGNVHKAMRKTGKKTFWDLYPHLPAETRNYVPTFTAILYAMKYAPEYHLHDAALRYQRFEALDTLGVRGQAIDLRRLSRALGYSDSLALVRYNPELRYASLPAGYRPYVLRYPSAAREHLGNVDHATLLAYCQPTNELPRPLLSRMVYLAGYTPPPGSMAGALPAADAAPRYRRSSYTVRRGQTLAAVAAQLGVSATQLRRWNSLPKNATPRPGQKLVVLQQLPPTESSVVLAAATPPAAASPLPRLLAPADSAAQALVAANARYAREAQLASEREASQARELLRRQRQLAARLVAQQRAAALQATALAKAAADEKKRSQAQAPELAAADNEDQLLDTPNLTIPRLDSLTPAPTTRRRRAKAFAFSQATEPDNSQAAAHSLPAGQVAETNIEPTENPSSQPIKYALGARSENKPSYYTVQPGDNLTHIARATGASLEQLREWNQLPTEGNVLAGQRLRLSATAPILADRTHVALRPASAPGTLRMSTHTVQPGDTLFRISQRFKVSVEELRRINHLKSDDVKLGQKLVVPAG